MSTSPTPSGPGWCRIRIHGHLDPRWSSWFDGMALTHDPDGSTLLEGRVADQAALHGLLGKIRDMGLPLISVARDDPGPTPGHHSPHQVPPP